MYPSLGTTPGAPAPVAASLAAAPPASGGGATPGDGPLFPLLRVQVAPELRMAPPADCPDCTTADAVPAAAFPDFDFGPERAVVEAAASSKDKTASTSPPPPPPDPWAPFLADHGPVPGGLGAALARARGPADAPAVATRVGALASLTAMGFRPTDAAGALESAGGDLQAATDACLAAQ